jgi:hypothetical protein
MSTTRKRPRLVNVHVIPWDKPIGLYGIACDFDDGITYREMWGTKEQAELMASLRRRDIFTEVNLKRN